MDSSPLSHRRSHLRLRSKPFDGQDEMENQSPQILTPPSATKTQISPSPLHDLLLLSHSPLRRRRTPSSTADGVTPISFSSPRSFRRARRRSEREIVVREERESGPLEDEVLRARKQRQSRPKIAHVEKLGSLGSPILSSASTPLQREQGITNDVARSGLDRLWELILELVMWENVAKSSLWFGFGSIFVFSSSFSRESSFSVISTISYLGIFVLAVAFFYDSFPQRQQLKWRGNFQLTEEDVIQAARVILPMANAALAKAQEMFSGEPSMTLKVAPVLLFTTKYGHLITLWRLFATGFFLCFTVPKLYSSYSHQIERRVENIRDYICEAWKSCPHKRFLAASTATVFWNLFSARTRIYTAFISAVILRYHHQNQIEQKTQRDV